MKFICSALILLTCCGACNHSEKTGNDLPGTDSTEAIEKGETNSGTDSATAVSATLDFLNWYKDNMIRLSRINLVDQTPGKNYSVNPDSCGKFLAELNVSGKVTSNFLNEKRKSFEEKKKDLEANPQNEGPPYGFEFDQVMMVQDIDMELDSLPRFKVVSTSVKSDTALVDFVLYYEYEFMLLRQNNNWLLDRILLVGDE